MSEKFGGLADRAEEWNFISFHVNMVTTMGALGAIGICIVVLLYCSSSSCWLSIGQALTCYRCTMGPDHLPTYKTAMSTTQVAVTMASALTPGELETLEQAKYLKLAKQKKKQPKVEPDNYLLNPMKEKNMTKKLKPDNVCSKNVVIHLYLKFG